MPPAPMQSTTTNFLQCHHPAYLTVATGTTSLFVDGLNFGLLWPTPQLGPHNTPVRSTGTLLNIYATHMGFLPFPLPLTS